MTARIPIAALACTIATGCVFGFDSPALQPPDASDADDLDDATDASDDGEDPDGTGEDVPADVDTDADEPEAVQCDPGGADDHCDGNELMRCRAEGDAFITIPCEGRMCVEDPGARCADMGVHNVQDASLLCAGTRGLGGEDVPDGMVWIAFLTETGELFAFNEDFTSLATIRAAGEGDVEGRVFTVQEQPGGGPALGILSLSELDLPEGLGLFTIGERAAVILSCGPVVIAGAMSAAAIPHGILPDTPGAGGSHGGTVSSPAGQGAGGGEAGACTETCTSGGAGGSHGGLGGAGGAALETAGGAPGAAVGDTTLVPLTAGSGGGAGGAPDGYGCAGPGGQGGGALLLASAESILVQPTGGIDAGGGAGRGGQGCGELVGGGAGGGGGSGGAILLEAPTVTIEGYLLAAGGGGGAGASSWTTPGMDGKDGMLALGPAQGGVGVPGGIGAGGGWGGLPATGDAGAGIGADCAGVLTAAGGGGGGDGIVRINALTTEFATDFLHPTFESGLLSTGSLLFL